MRRAKPKRVTWQLLDRWAACEEDKRKFADIFPSGVEVTFQSVLKCLREFIDVDWFLRRALSKEQYRIYDATWDDLECKYRLRRRKIRDKCRRMRREKREKLVAAEVNKWRRREAALIMQAWRGKLVDHRA